MSIFSFAGFAWRNNAFTVKKARRAWAAHKAMEKFRKENPTCAWCGRSKKLHVHHKVPVSVAPERAADPTNFTMLCGKGCHLRVGHNGNYRDRYIRNIKEICRDRLVIKTKAVK